MVILAEMLIEEKAKKFDIFSLPDMLIANLYTGAFNQGILHGMKNNQIWFFQ